MKFENFIRIGDPSMQIALPEGKWEIGATGGIGQAEIIRGTLYSDIILFQTIRDKVSKLVWISSLAYRFSIPQLCNADSRYKLHYIKVEGGWIPNECLYIYHYIPFSGGSDITQNHSNKKREREFQDWLTRRQIALPRQLLLVGYFSRAQAQGWRNFQVQYLFNPETDGFNGEPSSTWDTSPWHKAVIAQDSKRLAYIDRIKTWAKEWQHTVNAGFDNKLTGSPQPKLTPIVTTPPAPKSSNVSDRLMQLDALLKQELISKQEYKQRRKEILKDL